MSKMDADFWNDKYEAQFMPWDLGKPSRPLVEYLGQLEDKQQKILIPGAGSAHEAAWLHERGFTDVHVLDWAPTVVAQFRERYPDFPSEHVHVGDFFAHEGPYDLFVEQTFFCALDPGQRQDYADHAARILRPGGKLAGLLFNFPLEQGPPFGGSAEEYLGYFEAAFEILVMEPAYNSDAERHAPELFVILRRKS